MDYKAWVKDAAKTLINSYGLNSGFASKVALLYLYFLSYGLHPKITSGFRSPEYQKKLYDRWLAGDKSIVYKPALKSKHSVTKWGKPSALAVDISTNNPAIAALIARQLKVGAGFYFRKPDPVHFYV